MSLDISVVVLVLGITLALVNILYVCLRLYIIHNRDAQENVYDSNPIPLTNIVSIKVKMSEEMRKNHEFVKDLSFSEKLSEGANSLSNYKKASSYIICNEYKGE